MALFPSFAVVVFMWWRDVRATGLIVGFFAAGVVCGMMPVLRRRAGYSFWLFAIGCSIVAAPLTLLAARSAYLFFGPPPP
jgi:hypothetical protein